MLSPIIGDSLTLIFNWIENEPGSIISITLKAGILRYRPQKVIVSNQITVLEFQGLRD
jgi:hypothetical protein